MNRQAQQGGVPVQLVPVATIIQAPPLVATPTQPAVQFLPDVASTQGGAMVQPPQPAAPEQQLVATPAPALKQEAP